MHSSLLVRSFEDGPLFAAQRRETEPTKIVKQKGDYSKRSALLYRS